MNARIRPELCLTPAQWATVRARTRQLGGDDFAEIIRLAERFDRADATPQERALSRCLVIAAGATLKGATMRAVYRDTGLALRALAGGVR